MSFKFSQLLLIEMRKECSGEGEKLCVILGMMTFDVIFVHFSQTTDASQRCCKGVFFFSPKWKKSHFEHFLGAYDLKQFGLIK